MARHPRRTPASASRPRPDAPPGDTAPPPSNAAPPSAPPDRPPACISERTRPTVFLTIFLIALALVALAAWVMARAADDRIERNRLRLIATGITGCWIIVLFLCTFTLVKAVEVGVPVS